MSRRESERLVERAHSCSQRLKAFQFGQHQDSELESVCVKLGCVCARFGVSVSNFVCLSSGWGVCEKLGNLYWVSVVIFICLPAVILGFLFIPF